MPEIISNSLLNALDDEVHVWFLSPPEITDSSMLDEYRLLLSAEESERYHRFHFEKDQLSYLVSHALVRKTLSLYWDIRPEEWVFSHNEHGKPEVSVETGCPPIKFNLSHTDGMSLCVVSLNAECGVDVENILRKNNLASIAERMFADPELVTMRNCSDDEVRAKFFDYWTLRESYVKALGTGLSGSSKDFYFDISDTVVGREEGGERVAEICFLEKHKPKSVFWQFVLLKPTLDHVAAVALNLGESTSRQIVFKPFAI